MKLLIIAPEQNPIPPQVGGSVEYCIAQIAKRISDEHQVTVISVHRNGLPRKSVNGNTTIYRVSGDGSSQRYMNNVIQKVKGRRYDMIQIDNRPSFVRAVRKAFPGTLIAVFMHSMTFVSKPMTTKRRANHNFHYADLIVANSESLQMSLTKRFPEHLSKIRYVHLGVDTKKFYPDKKGRLRAFHFLFAGRLIPRKGIPILLKAYKIARRTVPSMRLSIAGGALKQSYKNELMRKVRKLNIPVTFAGNLSHDRMPAFYRSGHCLICPSQKHEAFGLVNVEAMACGLPVIASKIGGIPEIVEVGRNGLLVKMYRKPTAFASCMVNLAKDSALWNQLSVQARKDAKKRFSWRRTARSLIEIYEEYL
ncbi:glycosyltransferase family 4 protein [Paenibacillus albus]|uniref:Glycosyltransferase family 1 protein n=1 Tax=Paenibacillus albus TaxID=2495582 RepID=A0A3S9AAK6_9BACL|nr:glycosyltransferase family 4 protein [Paenibacillus albus]AZN42676.1 glycosyltransferase family 1 protein [Paenibacillus albus]